MLHPSAPDGREQKKRASVWVNRFIKIQFSHDTHWEFLNNQLYRIPVISEDITVPA